MNEMPTAFGTPEDQEGLFDWFMNNMRRKRAKALEGQNGPIEFHERPTSVRNLRTMAAEIRTSMQKVTDPTLHASMERWVTQCTSAVQATTRETRDQRFLTDDTETRVEIPYRRMVMAHAATYIDQIITGDREPRSVRVGRVDGNALKLVNDAFGHAGGNAYLGRIALELLTGKAMSSLKARNMEIEFATDGNGDEFYFVVHTTDGENLQVSILESAFAQAAASLWELPSDAKYSKLFKLNPERCAKIFPKNTEVSEIELQRMYVALNGFVIPPTFSWGSSCLADGLMHASDTPEFGPPKSVPLQSYQADVYEVAGSMMDAAGDVESARKKEQKSSWSQSLDPVKRALFSLTQRSAGERAQAMRDANLLTQSA
jgi:hypothetical protein